MSNVTLTPPAADLIEVLPGSPIPEKAVGSVAVGDRKTGDQLPAATLRHLATQRGGKLGKGKPTANAKAATAELERRSGNKAAKKAAAEAVAA